jgi:hypothetical protein
MNLDNQMIILWANNLKQFLEAKKEYSEEIRSTPDLNVFSHRFNITMRLARKVEK